MTSRRGLRLVTLLAVVAVAPFACGDGLSTAEDDWCSEHPVQVRQAVPPDKQDDVEYRDATWKDACRRAYAGR